MSFLKRLSGKASKKDQAPVAASSSTPAATTTAKAPAAATPAPAAASAQQPAATTTTTAAPATSTATSAAPATTTATTAAPATTGTMAAPKIAVIYHSFYGHVATLAEQVIAGAKAAGAQVDEYVFAETLPDEVLSKMHANKSLLEGKPVITADKLATYDGFLIGAGTRYGRLPAQVSAFFDTTGGLWGSGGLVGKFGGIFTSAASQHGGHESTAISTLSFFAHHGVTFVPIGFQRPELTDLSEIVGGSAYGASTIAGGDGSRQVSEKEKAIAKFQGEYFAKTVGTFVKGKSA